MLSVNDPIFGYQWHLNSADASGNRNGFDLNLLPVWQDYSGQGVRVAVVDSGVDYRHADLAGNYDYYASYDPATGDAGAFPSSGDSHGTAVAGIIAADNANGIGGVGIAPDATLVGIRTFGEGIGGPQKVDSMWHVLRADVDVANHSWGFQGPEAFFLDNFNVSFFADIEQAMERTAADGRDGLGTIQVFAAGNDRGIGQRADYHNINSSRYGVTVGAVDRDGTISDYSSPGASVLVSGFGTPGEVVTTDIVGGGGDDPSDYTGGFNGTSAAAPMVSGIVALMLEANPLLGYRDVQEILVYSARMTSAEGGWQINGADNWNGGGLHVSHDFGYGVVDAHAAVRLAETWRTQHTYWNEQYVEAFSATNSGIPDAGALTDSVSLSVAEGFRIDHVEVDVSVDHQWLGDLSLVLISPDGTRSILADRPGVTAGNPGGLGAGQLDFTFTSTQHWGEDVNGQWQLVAVDGAGQNVGFLHGWSLRAYGSVDEPDDTYIFTSEYGSHGFSADASRNVLADGDGGFDVINAAAVTTNQVIDLRAGAVSTIANAPLQVAAGSFFEGAFGGDGHDGLIGNATDNVLFGGRGNDVLYGEGGNDQLMGGAGQDVFAFTPGFGLDTILDFDILGGDVISLEHLDFASISEVSTNLYDYQGSAVLAVSQVDFIVIENVQSAQLAVDDFWL